MNINSATSFQTPFTQSVKANTDNPQSEKNQSIEIDERRLWSTIEKLRAPQVTGITSEDLDELQEFFNTRDVGPGFTDLLPLIEMRRFAIRWIAEIRAAATLSTMQETYSDFKKDLQTTRPELADKVFGFTLGEDGRLQVTAPPNTLKPWEEETLNNLLNAAKNLKALTLKHATAVIELVQLNKKQFEGKVQVDLTNFHKLIDYGLLLNNGALELGATNSWLDQLNKNIEKEPFEKKQGLHIEA